MVQLLPLLQMFLALSSGGIAVAVISVIRAELWFSTGYWWNGWWTVSTGTVCYQSTGSANMCSYGYVVGAVGIFLSAFIFFTSMSKLRPQWSTQRKFEVLLTFFGMIWWLPYAISITVLGKQADDAMLPAGYWRMVVWSLSWTCFALYVAKFVVAIVDMRTAPKNEYPEGTQYTSQPAYNPYTQQAPPAYPPGPPPPSDYGNYAYGNAAYQAQPPPYNPGSTVTGYPQGPPPSAGTQAQGPPPQAVRPV